MDNNKFRQVALLIKLEKKAEAREILHECLKTNLGDIDAWILLAKTYNEQKNRLAVLKKAVSLNPESDILKQVLLAVEEGNEIPATRFHGESEEGTTKTMQSNDGQAYKSGSRIPILKRSNQLVFNVLVIVMVSLCCVAYYLWKNPQTEIGKPFYIPNSDDAMSYACSYAEKLLDTWVGCVFEPECYRVEVEANDTGFFRVHGAMISVNQYCIKEVYYFTADLQYSDTFGTYRTTRDTFNPYIIEITPWRYDWKPSDGLIIFSDN